MDRNIDKAIEIAQKHHVIYDDYYDSIQECIESCREAMEWKDEQYNEERKDLLGLVQMIPVNENNQSVIEDLINILKYE